MQSSPSDLVNSIVSEHFSLAQKTARRIAKVQRCPWLRDDLESHGTVVLWRFAEWYVRQLEAGKTFEVDFKVLVNRPIELAVYARIKQERRRNPTGWRSQADPGDETPRGFDLMADRRATPASHEMDVGDLLALLTDNERAVATARKEGKSYVQIAEELGEKESWVRRIEGRAIDKVQRFIEDNRTRNGSLMWVSGQTSRPF